MTIENFLEGGPKSFLFRELPKNILFGTASDRYAEWIGLNQVSVSMHDCRPVPITLPL
jgi:hypothetical protein